MLEIDNLTVAIQENEEQVLKHLSLTIKPGESMLLWDLMCW